MEDGALCLTVVPEPQRASRRSSAREQFWLTHTIQLRTCEYFKRLTAKLYDHELRVTYTFTQKALAPSRHDWKIVDLDVKPQHKQTKYTLSRLEQKLSMGPLNINSNVEQEKRFL